MAAPDLNPHYGFMVCVLLCAPLYPRLVAPRAASGRAHAVLTLRADDGTVRATDKYRRIPDDTNGTSRPTRHGHTQTP
jgi:hypothetical protein